MLAMYIILYTGWFVGSLLLVLCSALSKEIGITAVAVCLAYEFLIYKKVHKRTCTHFYAYRCANNIEMLFNSLS